MKISEHLDLSEVIRSETAKRHGISNMPTEEHIANFKLLAENVFEKVRNHFRKLCQLVRFKRNIILSKYKLFLFSKYCCFDLIQEYFYWDRFE